MILSFEHWPALAGFQQGGTMRARCHCICTCWLSKGIAYENSSTSFLRHFKATYLDVPESRGKVTDNCRPPPPKKTRLRELGLRLNHAIECSAVPQPQLLELHCKSAQVLFNEYKLEMATANLSPTSKCISLVGARIWSLRKIQGSVAENPRKFPLGAGEYAARICTWARAWMGGA